ncbi:hypothetical protein CDAR_300571 [Caerostris darwini]|uniref:Uncharacterized protein n=1 Tax=Caerostris darwini TaxID=1538125 RepID=A0AAV4RR03_9ARAC|nr:hypothetical protein CDAR_300571 [Caerostris darwini]
MTHRKALINSVGSRRLVSFQSSGVLWGGRQHCTIINARDSQCPNGRLLQRGQVTLMLLARLHLLNLADISTVITPADAPPEYRVWLISV